MRLTIVFSIAEGNAERGRVERERKISDDKKKMI